MLQDGVDFDIDVNASVFETNIRGEVGFFLGLVLGFLPVRVSGGGEEGQREFGMQNKRKASNKRHFLSVFAHPFLLPVSTKAEVDVALSVFWCEVFIFGIH